MFEEEIFNKIKQLVPLVSKMSLFELGIVLFIISSLCKSENFMSLSDTVSTYGELSPYAVKFSYLLITIGIIRKVTVIDLSYNFSQNNKDTDIKFLHLYELEMFTSVQIPCEVMVGIKLFKMLPDFFIDVLLDKINFFLVFDYFSNQIDLDVSFYGVNANEIIYLEKRNKKKAKAPINNDLGKQDSIGSILILPQNYENKELIINLRLEPVKTNKLFHIPLFIFSYLLFPQKKMLII